MSVAFSLAWRRPLLGLLQTGIDPRHKARGPCASTKAKPVNDRPSPRSVLVQTSTHPSAAMERQASLKYKNVERTALIRLRFSNAATSLSDLRLPGLHLEPLKADRKGQHSIRINDRYRICFEWRDSDAYNVEIVDYH